MLHHIEMFESSNPSFVRHLLWLRLDFRDNNIANLKFVENYFSLEGTIFSNPFSINTVPKNMHGAWCMFLYKNMHQIKPACKMNWSIFHFVELPCNLTNRLSSGLFFHRSSCHWPIWSFVWQVWTLHLKGNILMK